MMKTMLISFVAYALFVLVTSCEGNTTRIWRVTNNSSTAVSIQADSNFSSIDVNTIAVGETSTILRTDQLGGNSNSDGFMDWLQVVIFNSTDTLLKDVNNEVNWSVESTTVSVVPADYRHEMNFEFEDGDF